jgi:hypothetical protein
MAIGRHIRSAISDAASTLARMTMVAAFGLWCQRESIMPQPDAPDHDQRLKVLIKEFFQFMFMIGWRTAFIRPNRPCVRTPNRLPLASRSLRTTPTSGPGGGFSEAYFLRPRPRRLRRCNTWPRTWRIAEGCGKRSSINIRGGRLAAGLRKATYATKCAAIGSVRGPSRRSIRKRPTMASAA